MSNLYVSTKYKNQIISLLLQNENFVRLMNPSELKSEALDGQIFDYDFTNETMSEQKTFVFVEADIDTIRDDIFTDFNLYIYIFTDKNSVKLTAVSTPTANEVKEMGYYASPAYGNRIDALCNCVDTILNGTEKIEGIGTLKPALKDHMITYFPNEHYYGKCLKYSITNYNSGGDVYGS